MADLNKSILSLTNPKTAKKIPGSLGISPTLINVPGRGAFCYVRLFGDLNELVEAYNAVVSPTYDLPVEVVYDGTKYVVVGRDINRYTNWGSSPYIPNHGWQHSWGSGDVTWIYSEQFIPLRAFPSGTSDKLFISPYVYNWNGAWKYGGNVYSPSMSSYLPADNTKQSIVLLYIDGSTTTPTWLLGTEAPLYTHINDLVPYLPNFDMGGGIPLAMVRIPSGTTQVGWNNVYDLRQYFTASVSGSSGGGGGGHTIQDEGTPLTQRTNLNFVGDGVTASDDAGNNATVITIPAASLPTFTPARILVTDGGGNVIIDDALTWDGASFVVGSLTGGYYRIQFLSGDATVAGVLNRGPVSGTALNFYFGEDADSGEWHFRGSGPFITNNGTLTFYEGTPVAHGAALTPQLTQITFVAPGTPDYAIQTVQLAGYGFATADEGNTLLSVIANLQQRVQELEDRLNSATGVNLFE
jgi:hypothetical protein